MRIFAALVLSTLLPAAAFADTANAAVDDEPLPSDGARATVRAQPAERHAPSDTGELRAVQIAAPGAVDVDDAAPVADEHAVAPLHAVAANATDGEVMTELAMHQMKRHQQVLDRCVAAAHKRAPAAIGTVTLDFEVADRKVKSVRAAESGVHDQELTSCLTRTARGLSFSLAAARFSWPVVLHP